MFTWKTSPFFALLRWGSAGDHHEEIITGVQYVRVHQTMVRAPGNR